MTLVVLARGTCQPTGPRTVEAVAARLRCRLSGVPVRTAYVEINRPSLAEVLAEVGGTGVVVPLPCAYDAAQPLAANAPAGALVSGSLGSDRLLAGVMRQRLETAGARPGQPVVMVAAGSSVPHVQGDSVRTAQLLEEVWGGPVRAALLTGRGPRMSEVVAELRTDFGAPPAVATFLVAPGPIHTRAREDARALALGVVADPMGDHPQVAEAVALRYRSATAHRFALSLS